MVPVCLEDTFNCFNIYILDVYSLFLDLQNLFLYGYGAMFNFLGIVVSAIVKGKKMDLLKVELLNLNLIHFSVPVENSSVQIIHKFSRHLGFVSQIN